MKQTFSMLQLASLLLVCSLYSSTVFGQGAYVRAGLGFGLGVSNDVLAYDLTVNSQGKTIEQTNVFGTLGTAPSAKIGGGYMFNEYIGLGMDISYFHSIPTGYGEIVDSIAGKVTSRKANSTQFRMSPNVIVKAPVKEMNIYARFGLVIPFTGKTIIQDEATYFNNATGRNATYRKSHVRGGFSVGYESALGAEFSLNEKLNLFAEIQYQNMRIKSRDAKVVEYTITNTDGVTEDQLSTLKVAQQEIIFTDKSTLSSNYSADILSVLGEFELGGVINSPGFDFDKPLEAPTQMSTYNSISLQVGVHYNF